MGLPETNTYTILENLKNDFEEKWNNGVRKEIKDVKIGIVYWDVLQFRPAIVINGYNARIVEELMINRSIVEFDIDIDIYVNYNENFDLDWKEIYTIQDQIWKFLRSTDNTYYESTHFKEENDVVIGSTEGGSTIAMARCAIRVDFIMNNN